MLIRVATVTATEDCRVKVQQRPSVFMVVGCAVNRCVYLQVHYDGWSQQFDVWCDSDISDLHPFGWCQRTGHPLEPPPGLTDSVEGGGNNAGVHTPGQMALTLGCCCI